MFKNGIDVLFDDVTRYFEKGEKIGLITNPTGVNLQLKTTIDLLANCNYVDLKCLFALEHGIRGSIPAGVSFDDTIDEITKMKVYSLYNKNKRISKEVLDTVDTIVFDVQDVGVRYYTYFASLVYAIQMCSEENKRLVVLDRPNPIGCKVFGNLLDINFKSFVGPIETCSGTGLTIGELALLTKDLYYPKALVTVVAMQGYQRNCHITDLDNIWIAPSPNIPFKRNVDYYPLTCVIEGTNVSEGRGTTKPFEIIGAPWFKELEVIKALKIRNLEGVDYYPVYFKPTSSKQKDEQCKGIQIFITNIDKIDYTRFPYELLSVIKAIHKEFKWIAPFKEGRAHFIDYLCGSNEVRLGIDANKEYSLFEEKWTREQETYKSLISKYYIYK